MQTLTPNDYKLFKTIAGLTQEELRKAMAALLKKKYETVVVNEKFIYAIGEIPIGLVAHLDTVFKTPPSTFYYDKEQGVIWSPDGLGADDRAGIFAIVKILQSGLRPSIILPTDEEIGGIGSEALVKQFVVPFTPLNYLIQLDRRGTSDCVFYDCNNDDFNRYVEEFGFIINFGSFSDISVICPEWKIAGVNLSIGYEDEHSYSETLHINPMLKTIERVKNMLSQTDIPEFKYIPSLTYGYKGYSLTNPYSFDYDEYDMADDGKMHTCAGCGKDFISYELFPVKTIDNRAFEYYCPDCCVDHVDWCTECGNSFRAEQGIHMCPDCRTIAENEKKWNITSKKSKNKSKK